MCPVEECIINTTIKSSRVSNARRVEVGRAFLRLSFFDQRHPSRVTFFLRIVLFLKHKANKKCKQKHTTSNKFVVDRVLLWFCVYQIDDY